MARIESIDITHHQLPLDPPFPASWDPQPRTKFPVTIVRVRDSDGRVGIGSGDVMYGFAEYAMHFLGQEAGALDRHSAVLANIEFHAGRPWPLDVALWDLAAKTAEVPLWRLLGGSSPRVRVYASSGVRRPVDGMVRMAEAAMAAGFDALKLRFGRPDVNDDIAVVAAVRAACGPQLTLMVDCNQGWRMPWDTQLPWDVNAALAVGERLEDLGVYWVEEPLHRGDYDGYAALRRRLGVKIAGGEMTREPYEFRELLERECLDVYQPDCVCTQGISGLAPLARVVRERGHLFTPHTWGNGIGLLANLHLVAGTVGHDGSMWVEYPWDPPEWTVARRDYPLRDAVTARDGWVTLDDRPGLGAELDDERLARTRSASATFA
jgi:L-alanine-DL-glutamate epimerase-like enolase superfamily enzyme